MKALSRFFKVLLLPFSLLYGLIVAMRNMLFDLNILTSTEFKIPIISVGNITVGGTGKTPHIEYLIVLLKNDYKLATLSRGYKRKSRGFILSGKNSTANQIGDEPMQIKRKFPDILVSVDNKRVNGVKNLLKNEHGNDLSVILLDDAYQHRYIKPGLSILLIDYNRLITRDFIMPYGRLRESAEEYSRANIIIVSKTPVKMTPIERRIIVKELKILPYQELYFTCLNYGNLQPVFRKDAVNVVDADWKKESLSILLVTGIANPKPLREHLDSFSNRIEEFYFPDHHAFNQKDIQTIENKFNELLGEHKIIITTEKDATRIFDMEINQKNIKKYLFYVPLYIKFLNEDKSKFDNRILNYVKKNKRSSNLHNIETNSI